MPNTARVTFSIVNQTFSVAALLKGVGFVGGITLRGPINDPVDIITSWTQFTRIFGGFITTSDFPLLCKRALDYGAQLRVARIANYTDPADASTLTATKATLAAFVDGLAATLFTLTMKYPGADYANVTATVSAASNGNANYFNLTISHANDANVTETYANITIPGAPTAANSHYLDDVIRGSNLVDVTYADLSAMTAPLRPVDVVTNGAGGSDGSAVVAGDYAGDPAGRTGLYAFDPYDDAMQIGFPEISDSAIHIAGAAYADTRKDIIYFAHLDNADVDANTYLSDRDGTNIDSTYTAFFGGGLKILDPVTSIAKNISELGDIFGIAAASDNVSHEWYSFAGINRGKLRNALGVVNNFGTPALQADLNLLANHQINMVVVSGGVGYLSGNFAATLGNSQQSFLNTNRFLIYLKKSLGPLLKTFLEQPADIATFKAIYRGVEPFLDNLVTQRALFSYVWDGDQDISKIEDVRVNNLTDLGNGKYKVKLFMKIVPSLNEIAVELIITALSVDFNVIINEPTI